MANDYTDKFEGTPYFIKKGEQLSAAGMTAALNTKEKVANKKDTINNSSIEYPSSKAVSDALSSKQNKVAAGTLKDILAYSGTAGTFDILARTTSMNSAENASDNSIPTEKAVATALNSKLSSSDLTTLRNDISALQTAVGGKQDSLTTAQQSAVDSGITASKVSSYDSYFANLSFFPKGTILAFSKTAWEDDTSDDFRRIWKVCNAANHAANSSIPDLTNKFLRGGNPDDYGATGNGTVTLSAANLPAHKHNITDKTHYHTPRNGYISETTGSSGGWNNVKSFVLDEKNYTGGLPSGFDLDNVRTANSYSGITSTENNTGGGQSFDVVPAYYTVIYIIKIL
ncbi:MAG: hypothetical protein LBK68_06235 [Candidatus Margulisbacteria bacterium]|jgi:hypothetical protein|nr:hypothetical protein [Candidatus Margulisiibacteriota bacterium]